MISIFKKLISHNFFKAWTPFIAEGAQAVLCQGTLVTPDNVDATLDDIIKRLQILEKRSNEVSNDVHNLMVEMRTEAERLTARLKQKCVFT